MGEPSNRPSTGDAMMPARRLAIATGTSSGIGEEVTHQLLHRGWDVIGIARRGVSIGSPRYTHCSMDLGDVNRLTASLDAQLASRVRDGALARLALVNNA